MYVFITLFVLFLVLFSSACLHMTVCIDLCALTPPVCGLSFISIKFCSVLFCSFSSIPAGIWWQNDVVSTSMRRDDVASTLIWRHFGTKCPRGWKMFLRSLKGTHPLLKPSETESVSFPNQEEDGFACTYANNKSSLFCKPFQSTEIVFVVLT